MCRSDITTKHHKQQKKETPMATKEKNDNKSTKRTAEVQPMCECSVYNKDKFPPTKDTEVIKIIVGKGFPKCFDAERFLMNVCDLVGAIFTLMMDEHKKGKKCNDCGKVSPVDDSVLKKQILALRDVGLSIKAIAKQVHKSDRFVAKVVKGDCK